MRVNRCTREVVRCFFTLSNKKRCALLILLTWVEHIFKAEISFNEPQFVAKPFTGICVLTNQNSNQKTDLILVPKGQCNLVLEEYLISLNNWDQYISKNLIRKILEALCPICTTLEKN